MLNFLFLFYWKDIISVGTILVCPQLKQPRTPVHSQGRYREERCKLLSIDFSNRVFWLLGTCVLVVLYFACLWVRSGCCVQTVASVVSRLFLPTFIPKLLVGFLNYGWWFLQRLSAVSDEGACLRFLLMSIKGKPGLLKNFGAQHSWNSPGAFLCWSLSPWDGVHFTAACRCVLRQFFNR